MKYMYIFRTPVIIFLINFKMPFVRIPKLYQIECNWTTKIAFRVI